MKHTLAQKGKTSPAIPHPFDQLELVHEAFHLPV